MKPLIIYHRGRHGKIEPNLTIQENSIEAFTRALQEGAQVVEFDVWEDLKIAHDPGADERCLRLPELLDLIKGRCIVNIEVKAPQAMPDAVKCVDRCIAQGDWSVDQFVFSAFHHETALKLKELKPNYRVAVVNDGVLLSSYIESLADKGINNLHLEWANIFMDMQNNFKMREVIRKRGLQLWVWTVNSKEVFDVLVEYGVDAVFTDKPDLLRT